LIEAGAHSRVTALVAISVVKQALTLPAATFAAINLQWTKHVKPMP
jgi:hypothetical protein